MYVHTNVNVFLLSIIQLFLFCICVYCAYCLLTWLFNYPVVP